MKKVIVRKSPSLSSMYDERFVVLDEETGEILDDAQGYGYKSAQKAHAAWGYKNRDRSKDAAKAKKKKEIMKWAKEHRSFMNNLDDYAFRIAKGSMGPDDVFDYAVVKEFLASLDEELPFTPREFWNVIYK